MVNLLPLNIVPGEAVLPGDWSISPVITALEAIDHNLNVFGFPEIWKQTRGAGVRVLITDTGVDREHLNLQHVKSAVDFTGSPYGSQDLVGHGTWCTGIVGARGRVEGIASECEEHHAKVLNDKGTGSVLSLVKGIQYGIDIDADIISASWGGMGLSQYLIPIITEFLNGRPGRFFVCSAGNNGQVGSETMTEPAVYDNVLSVGACDWHGNLAPFSSVGKNLDIVMPGVDIISTVPENRGRYGKMSGTSMAAPIMAGLIALILSKHKQQGGATPVLTLQHLLEHLSRTSIDKGEAGRDDLYGFGVVDPARLFEDTIIEHPKPPVQDPPIKGKKLFSAKLFDSYYTVITSEVEPKNDGVIQLNGN